MLNKKDAFKSYNKVRNMPITDSLADSRNDNKIAFFFFLSNKLSTRELSVYYT